MVVYLSGVPVAMDAQRGQARECEHQHATRIEITMTATQVDINLVRRWQAMTKAERDALRGKAIVSLEADGELERRMWRLLRWECEALEQKGLKRT